MAGRARRIALLQGADPRGLPQRDLSRTARPHRDPRGRGRDAGIFRQGGSSAHDRRGGAARRDHPRPEHLRAGRRPGSGSRPPQHGARPDARARDDRPGRVRPGPPRTRARALAGQPGSVGAVLRRPRPAGARAAVRRGGLPGARGPHRDHARPVPPRSRAAPAGRRHRDRAGNRRDSRSGRRAGLSRQSVQPRHPGSPAAGLSLQAGRVSRGPSRSRRRPAVHAGLARRRSPDHAAGRRPAVEPAQLRRSVRRHRERATGPRAVTQRRDGPHRADGGAAERDRDGQDARFPRPTGAGARDGARRVRGDATRAGAGLSPPGERRGSARRGLRGSFRQVQR